MRGIALGHGVRATHFIASGGLAFDGRGWWWDRLGFAIGAMRPIPDHVVVIVKTLTRHPRVGNLKMWRPWECVRRLSRSGEDITFDVAEWRDDDGFLNAVGLTNPGFDAWCERYYVSTQFSKRYLVLSLDPHTPEEAAEMAEQLERRWHSRIIGIELNASCPNTGTDPSAKTALIVEMARAILRITKIPLLVKLGVTNDAAAILEALREEPIAVDLMNTVPWALMYPDKPSPLLHLGGGGVSGPVIIPKRDELYRHVRSQFPHVPILLSAGIWDKQSYQRTVDMEPDAVGFGTVLLKRPNLVAEVLS